MAPRTTSNRPTPASAITITSSVVRARCVSTLSMTTWKISGVMSAKIWMKSEASSTSPISPRYLRSADQNQPMPKARGTSASRAATIHSPVQSWASFFLSVRCAKSCPACWTR